MQKKLTDQVLPNNPDAERAVLGAMMMPDVGTDAARKAVRMGLKVQHFDNVETHQRIYLAILKVLKRGDPVDTISVEKALTRSGDLDRVGGVAYLDELADSTPTAANIEHYVEMVMEEAERRAMVWAAQKALDDTVSMEELRLEYERVKECRPRDGMFDRPDAIDAQTFLAMDVPPIPMLIGGGLVPAYGYTIMGGYAKAGKTTLALQMAICLVSQTPFAGTFDIEKENARVLFCYLENAPEGIHQILDKQAQGWGSEVDMSNLILQEAQGLCLEYPEDRAWLRDLIEEHSVDLCIIDPVSLAMRKDQNAYEVVREFGLSIKEMGSQTGTAFLLIHHLRKPGAVKVEPMHALCGSSAWGNFAESIVALGRWEDEKPPAYCRLSLKPRTAAEPEDICLYRNPAGVFELYADPNRIPKLRTENVVAIVRDTGPIGYNSLVEMVMEAEGVSEPTAKRKIKEALTDREVKKDSKGKYVEA